jgi:hypothetical protein
MDEFNDKNDLIGDGTKSLTGKTTFSGAGFNDGAGDLPLSEKQEVNHSDSTPALGYPDNAGIVDGGHISG